MLLLFQVLLSLSLASAKDENKGFFLPLIKAPVHEIKLDESLWLKWQVDYERNDVIFEVVHLTKISGKFLDWVGVGFSDFGESSNADFCILWTDWKGQVSLEDTFTNHSIVFVDDHNDCRDFEARKIPNGLAFTFKRLFDTCDDQDYLIEDGTVHLNWVYGKGPLYKLNHLDVNDPSIAKFGFSRARLLKVDIEKDWPKDAQVLSIRHSVELPPDETVYWCSVHKLPPIFQHKHQAIQYEPIMMPGNEHLLHHMEVFHCIPSPADESTKADFPIWSGPCGSNEAPEALKHCKKVLAAWAIGAEAFQYPKEAGLQIGGPDFESLYVMLEVHFNNENLERVKDNSGMSFIVTQQLRPYDAGIMELGLIYNDLMAIPPQSQEFPLHSYCLPQCTAVGFPGEGIHIFGSQLHTHGTGYKVETRHFREGREMPVVNQDNHYSTHFQEIRPLHNIVHVLPGDELITTCTYHTLDKTEATVGGFTFNDEMCVNYIHYYPRTKHLEICKSSVDEGALDEYFNFLKIWDGQETNAKDWNATNNYRAIKWTPLRAANLANFYQQAPTQMQCQSGSGSQLPGKWKEMSRPQVELKGYDGMTKPRRCHEGKIKRAGRPFNEMKRKRTPILSKKRDFEESGSDVDFDDYDEDEDLSKYWSDYEPWGYDKRSSYGSLTKRNEKKSLGSMKKKRTRSFENERFY